MDLNKQGSISDTTKLREKPNHKSIPSYTSKKNLTKLNLTTCPFGSTSETPDAASATNG